jgi:lipid-binding SYLF domain-containing protein
MQHEEGEKEMKLRALLAWSAVAMLFVPTALRADVDRLKDAQEVLTDMAASKDEGIPVDLIEQAKCLAIVPGVKKAAVGIGGEYGRGYLVCRRADGKTWSAPGGVRIEGGSVGFQIGGAETDVIMIVRNDRGVDRLLSNKFTVGADASVAAGPVGRQAGAQTDATMRAEMLAWSHSRGVFAGIALRGATLREDDSENRALYGREMSNREIVKGNVPVPREAEGLLAVLSKY